jgi:hypothetical protein
MKTGKAVRIGAIIGGVGGFLLGFTVHDDTAPPLAIPIGSMLVGILVGVSVVGAVRILQGMLGMLVDSAAQAQREKQEKQRQRQLSGGMNSIEFRSVPKVASSTRFESFGVFSKTTTTTTYNIGDSRRHVASWKRTVLHPARLGLAGLSVFSIFLSFSPDLSGFLIPGFLLFMAALFFSAPHYEMALRALEDRGDRSPGFMSWVRYCLNRPFRMVPEEKWRAFVASFDKGR